MRYLFRVPAFLLVLILSNSTGFAQILGDLVDTPSTLGESVSIVAGKSQAVAVQSAPVLTPFTGLAVEIGSNADDLTGEVRFESNGSWGEWITLFMVRSATEGLFVAGHHGRKVYQNGRFEIRINGPSDRVVIIRNAGTFDNRSDIDRRKPAPGVVPLRGAVSGIVIPPPLITRAEWGAAPFIGTPVNLARPTYEYMTFHHAAGFSATTLEEGLAQVKAIQDLHQNVRGWSDIGYQFAIDRSGRLYQGRPFMDNSTSLAQVPVLAMGAHVGGHNTGNIGVVLLGCYHPPEGSYCQEVPTEEALDTYVTLFSFLSERYGVAPTLIRGHRDFSPTACPGDNNYVRLPEVRQRVEDLLITGNQALGSASLEASLDDAGVATISWQFLEDFGISGYRIERTYGGVTTVVFAGENIADFSYADPDLTVPGPATYALYAMSTDGRVQRLSSVEILVEGPGDYVLAETFPNPVRDRATFRYFLSRDGVVTLTVFDATGREVHKLVDGFQDGDRWYVSSLDMSGLSGGIYYFRVRVEGFSGTVFDKTNSFALVH